MRCQLHVVIGILLVTVLVAYRVAAESNIRPRTVEGEATPSERDEQESLFNWYFREQNLTYQTEFAALKTSATVDAWRIPYSAAIYPLTSGGLAAARTSAGTVLMKYDRAFNEGQSVAESYDRRRRMPQQAPRIGLFRRRLQPSSFGIEPWEGYCSGFAASTIRHPEPMRPVDAGTVGGRPGVVFQPAEIKTLLSAAYNRTRPDSFLLVAPPSARNRGPNMGTFHLALANYIGQAQHPVAIDRVRGREAWNNPIYKYEVTSIRDVGRRGELEIKELVTRITYTAYGSDRVSQTDPETGQRRGHSSQSMSIRYHLNLDAQGQIVGGRALSHSGHFLWLPLFAIQATSDQTSPGNPYLDVQIVIALARASALPEIQAKYDQHVIGKIIDPEIAARADAEREQAAASDAESS